MGNHFVRTHWAVKVGEQITSNLYFVRKDTCPSVSLLVNGDNTSRKNTRTRWANGVCLAVARLVNRDSEESLKPARPKLSG